VYPSVRELPDHPHATLPQPRTWFRVGRNVISLGFTSLVTDISSEMVTAIIPLYLTFQLGFSPLELAMFAGAYEGVTGLVRIFGGFIADRRNRYKEVAGAGYGISAFCKLGLFVSGRAWLPATGFLFADRVGKGIRTSPRDALISLSAPATRLGQAFGVHRAMDTCGALIGPVVAFTILDAAHGAYDAVLMVSFLVGLIGLAILVLFVQNRKPADEDDGHTISRKQVRHLLRDRRFATLTVASGILGLVTIGDVILYILFQRRSNMQTQFFPLLYVGTAFVYLVLAIPAGRLADRIGPTKVFLAGNVALAGAYATLIPSNPGAVSLVAMIVLIGIFYAMTDGVLMALASRYVEEDLRTTGFATITTVVSLAKFVGATIFGLVWTWYGPTSALEVFTVGLVVAVIVATQLLHPRHEAPLSPVAAT
jgi:MFS family permease